MKKKAVIIDIDGTLANNDHRQHFLEKTPKDWKGFFAYLMDDTPNEWCKQIIFAMEELGYHMLFVSGRSDVYRAATELWLHTHLLTCEAPKLYMRSFNDMREDTVIKQEIYHNVIHPQYNVLFCIDDRPSVCRMWRSLGLTVLQCNDKEF